MKYFNLLDDAVDDPRLRLTPDEKACYLERAVAVSWATPSGIRALPETVHFEQALALGAALRSSVKSHEDPSGYVATIHEFARAQAAHAYAVSVDALLASVPAVGRACGGIMASVVDLVAPCSPAVHAAAGCLGTYGLFLDHAYEVNADLLHGSPTAVTAFLRERGDSRTNRRAGRKLCLDAAAEVLAVGIRDLSPRQATVYRSLANAFALRYKVAARASDARV